VGISRKIFAYLERNWNQLPPSGMASNSLMRKCVLFQFKSISAIVATKVGGAEGVVKLPNMKHWLTMDSVNNKSSSFTKNREVNAVILMFLALYAIAMEVFQAEFQIGVL
jgi:hypothetical protein